MIAVLVRLWIVALMVLAAIFALVSFSLLTVAPVIIGVLWAVLAISLLLRLVLAQPTP